MRANLEILRAPLRSGAFRRLWLGILLSRVGDTFTVIALSWFVLQLAGPGAVGLVLALFGLPVLVSGPVAGRLLDRYGPQPVMGLENLFRAGLISLIPALHWLGALEVWHVYPVALLCGFFSPATEVGEGTVVPRLVADDELEGANSLISANWEFASLVGPAAAGFLVATVGAPAALMVDAATFLVMGAVAFSLPRLTPEPSTAEEPSLRETLFGFRLLVRMKVVGFVTVLSLAFLLVHGVQEVVLPVFSKEVLAAGAAGYGILASALGAGSLLGLLLTGPLVRKAGPGLVFGVIFVAAGVMYAPLALVEGLPLALVFIFLVGFVSAPYYVVSRSLMQRLVPDHLRGQVFGVRASLNAAGFPLGSAVGGFLLASFSVPFVIALAALASAALGLAALLSPTLRDTENRSSADRGTKTGAQSTNTRKKEVTK